MWRKSVARGVGHYRTDGWRDLSAAFTKEENTLWAKEKVLYLKKKMQLVTTTEATTSSGGRDFGSSFGNTQANNSSHSWGERQEVMGTRFNERDWIFHLLRVSVAGGQGPGIPPATNLLSHDGRTLLFELNIKVGYKLPSLLPDFTTSPPIFCSFWMNMFLDPGQLLGELGKRTLPKLDFYTQFGTQ